MKKFVIREYTTLIEEHEHTVYADTYDEALCNIAVGIQESCHKVNTYVDDNEYHLIEEKDVE